MFVIRLAFDEKDELIQFQRSAPRNIEIPSPFLGDQKFCFQNKLSFVFCSVQTSQEERMGGNLFTHERVERG